MILLWGKAFGYAKPVPINPYNFKNPKKDMMWVAIAGPGSNLTLALILGILTKLSPFPYLTEILLSATVINVILAFFNLIPIPPLDGSKILAGLLPYKLAYRYLRLESLGFIFMVILIFTNSFQGFIFFLEKITLNCLGVKAI
jgi:Zn-dependent protease